MSSVAYTRYELKRTFRNRRLYFFSLGFPLILYWLIAGPQRDNHNFNGSGLSFPLYYMVGLAAFGTMMAMLTTGARIAGERQVGWTRQLRITPLSARAYFRAKVITAYAMCGLSLGLLYLSGAALGVSLSAGRWFEMTALIAIGLLPLAALGIVIGHLVNTDSADRRPAASSRCSRSSAAPGSRSRAASCTRSASCCHRGGSCRRATSR